MTDGARKITDEERFLLLLEEVISLRAEVAELRRQLDEPIVMQPGWKVYRDGRQEIDFAALPRRRRALAVGGLDEFGAEDDPC